MPRTRKEIDKEAMFYKIMPSARLPLAEVSEGGEPRERETSSQISGIGARKSVLGPTKEVHLNEQPETAPLVNLTEQMVADKLDDAITKFHCCKCDKCKKDVAAIALNKLKPRYVVAEKVKALSNERAASTEVMTAIVQAILIVKAHPRH
ncbi:MAG: late competence development ComFB family protein [Hydrogenoanaerobacterium sp.]